MKSPTAAGARGLDDADERVVGSSSPRASSPLGEPEPTALHWESTGAVRTLLGVIERETPRGVMRLEIVHRARGFVDSLQFVLVRGVGKAPLALEINHRDIGVLRDAVAAFAERVREKHARRPPPKAKPWDDQRRAPGVPRGSAEPRKGDR